MMAGPCHQRTRCPTLSLSKSLVSLVSLPKHISNSMAEKGKRRSVGGDDSIAPSTQYRDNGRSSPVAQQMDVIIPSALLDAAASSPTWHPGPSGSSSSGSNQHGRDRGASFVQEMANNQTGHIQNAMTRSGSVSLGALARSRVLGVDSRGNDFRIAGPPQRLRKTSLPTVQEMKSPAPSRDVTPTFPRSLASSSSSSEYDGDTRARDTEDTVYYQRLSQFSFGSNTFGSNNASRSSWDAGDDAVGPSIKPTHDHGRKQSHNFIARVSVDEHNQKRFIEEQTLKRSSTSGTRRGTLTQVTDAVQDTLNGVADRMRRGSVLELYEKAKVRGAYLRRKPWVQKLFEYVFYFILICLVYFVLIGVPLWKGAVWWLWYAMLCLFLSEALSVCANHPYRWVVQNKFVLQGGFAITVGLAALYAFSPLLVLFEKDPPMPAAEDVGKVPGTHDTALLIPCYKSAKIIGPTLEAALRIFPASHIFVIANGNSPTPLDNTEEVCRPYGVNHIWSPVGSKIVAQFVGCYAAKAFKNVLLIDDDCALPPNFPIVSARMKGKIQCIGYTIKSVGPDSSRGTLCQQAQDLEYKLSGIQRAFAGYIGSATFPHGAISIWNTEFLIKTFHEHPGFSVSEDWFFGHVARKLGCRITMCTSVFVETETPSSVLFSSGGARGGFGEMTIFKQRFKRWNFFFVNGMWYNMSYIFGSWRLGFGEFGAKLFVFQEVYETLLYLLTPFVLPISFIVRPSFCGYLLIGTIAMYYINTAIFNEIHLRLKKERVHSMAAYVYYMPYKVVLTVINVTSCYWSLYKYATYFAKRHPKVIEDEKAVEVVLRLEEQKSRPVSTEVDGNAAPLGRRLTVTAVGTRLSVVSASSNPFKDPENPFKEAESKHDSGQYQLERSESPVDPFQDPHAYSNEAEMTQLARLDTRDHVETTDFALQVPKGSIELGEWQHEFDERWKADTAKSMV